VRRPLLTVRNALSMPSIQSLIPNLVEREEVARAVSVPSGARTYAPFKAVTPRAPQAGHSDSGGLGSAGVDGFHSVTSSGGWTAQHDVHLPAEAHGVNAVEPSFDASRVSLSLESKGRAP
jgi:hypothetical protein